MEDVTNGPKTTILPSKAINVNDLMLTFCMTNEFKKHVRQAINDEMFWRDILTKYNITDGVKKEIDNQLRDKMPTQVKNEAKAIINKMVNDFEKTMTQKLDQCIQFGIPNSVAKALHDQITGFLNNHTQMNQIMAQHLANLNSELYASVANILHKLVNEDQYHQVSNAHMESMKVKFNELMNTMNVKSDSQTMQIDTMAKNKMKTIEDDAKSKMKMIDDANQRIDTQNNVIHSYQKRISDLEDTMGWFSTIVKLCVVSSVTVMGIGMYALKYK